jgi:hypothetical protein
MLMDDDAGRRHMEYIRFAGMFADLLFEAFSADMRRHHPRMLEALENDRAARKTQGQIS